MPEEPFFLALAQVEAIHKRSLLEHGGADGISDPGGLESAVMQPRNIYHYLNGGLCLSHRRGPGLSGRQQADGHRLCAGLFGVHGIETTRIDPMELYQPMIDISARRLDREGLAERLRQLFG